MMDTGQVDNNMERPFTARVPIIKRGLYKVAKPPKFFFLNSNWDFLFLPSFYFDGIVYSVFLKMFSVKTPAHKYGRLNNLVH